MTWKNCWEVKNCGREPGGAKVAELGACPAATETRADGVNQGRNGGRVCWAIVGTMCAGEVQGTYASKIPSCLNCEFYQSVHRDLKESDPSRSEHPSRVLDLVLERTAALEHEIEQRRQVEEALRQTNKKLNLLSSITRHDMLNKLHTIGLLMELLGQQSSPDPELVKLVSKIEIQFRDLTDMVWFTNDYQDLGVSAPAWQSLNDVIAGVRKWVHSVPIEMDPGLDGYEIFADPLLGKVFYNLADNAVQHGGHVSRILVRGVVEPEGLVIFWEDDGVGVPNEEKEKIFAKGHGRNTGLGLFLVREILSITSISIRETGIPGKGVLFEMIVPEGSYRLTGQ
jgi:signal transduction histidine kinase